MPTPSLLAALAAAALLAPGLRADAVGAVQALSFSMKYEFRCKPGTKKVVFTSLVPQTLPGKQDVLKVTYAPEPEKVFREHGHKYARFAFEDPKELFEVSIDVDAEIYASDLSNALRVVRSASVTLPDPEPWLAEERFLEKDAPEIQKVARSIVGRDDLDTLRQIVAYVGKTLTYAKDDPADVGALAVLRKKQGVCSGFADLFVALCRAKGIPARCCTGYVATTRDPLHRWAEAFIRNVGWVPFDPTHIAAGATRFETMRVHYVYLNLLRTDPVIRNGNVASYVYWGEPARMRHAFVIRKRQAKEVLRFD